ncbi:hypothetical protein MAP00_004111 [Monascus purpureus]|nr:hypothetical protein MAP00_004111 [Monascus purpureus]
MLKTLSPATLTNTVRNETLAIHVFCSSLVEEITSLADAAGRVIVGSRANISGSGQEFLVEDIEPEI